MLYTSATHNVSQGAGPGHSFAFIRQSTHFHFSAGEKCLSVFWNSGSGAGRYDIHTETKVRNESSFISGEMHET